MRQVLGRLKRARDLTAEELLGFTEISRRIAALVMLSPKLDAAYHSAAANAYPWPVTPSLADTGAESGESDEAEEEVTAEAREYSP